MGLFISEDKHQAIYQTKEATHAPNQAIFKRNHSDELLEAQQKQFSQLQQAMLKLSILSKQQGNKQMTEWQNISEQLSDLQNKGLKQEQIENKLTEQLAIMTEEYRVLHERLGKETVLNQEIVKQIEHINGTNDNILESINKRKDIDKEVFKRIEDQEAVTEKVSRQIDTLRSVLYERTNFLAEKLDDGFKRTSAYLYQLLTRSDQSLTFFLPKKDKK